MDASVCADSEVMSTRDRGVVLCTSHVGRQPGLAHIFMDGKHITGTDWNSALQFQVPVAHAAATQRHTLAAAAVLVSGAQHQPGPTSATSGSLRL